MSGLPIGPFKEVFQLVDERFPRHGRKMTSAAGLLIVIGIILLCLALIVSIVGRALGALGIVHWPSFPAPPLSSFAWVMSTLIILWFFGQAFRIRTEFYEKQRAEERELEMVKLLSEIRDSLLPHD